MTTAVPLCSFTVLTFVWNKEKSKIESNRSSQLENRAMRKLSATAEKAKFIGGVLADTYFNKRRYYVHQVEEYSVIEIKITSVLIYCLTVRNRNVTAFL